MSEEKKAIFLKGYFTANELMRIADEMMHDEFTKAPSQDELWAEMFRVDEEEGTQEVKKRYRIIRITS